MTNSCRSAKAEIIPDIKRLRLKTCGSLGTGHYYCSPPCCVLVLKQYSIIDIVLQCTVSVKSYMFFLKAHLERKHYPRKSSHFVLESLTACKQVHPLKTYELREMCD